MMGTERVVKKYEKMNKMDMNSNIRYACGHGAENIKDKQKVVSSEELCSVCRF